MFALAWLFGFLWGWYMTAVGVTLLCRRMLSGLRVPKLLRCLYGLNVDDYFEAEFKYKLTCEPEVLTRIARAYVRDMRKECAAELADYLEGFVAVRKLGRSKYVRITSHDGASNN